jgi:hypothetical protein
MKTTSLCIAFLLALCVISTVGLSQEQVILTATTNSDTTPVPQGTKENDEDEDAPVFSFSGSVDTYFHSTLETTNSFYGGLNAPASAFADQKGFGLGMVNLVASYSAKRSGVVADLVFGPRGRAAVFTSSQGIINQMYAYYKLADNITLNLGQFNTFLGYEVISPAVNFHYSTSYMFSY